jgi:hypothetical protein
VRRAIVLADVCLDLDDPADSRGGAVAGCPDEAQANERRRDLERRPAEERSEVAQLDLLAVEATGPVK